MKKGGKTDFNRLYLNRMFVYHCTGSTFLNQIAINRYSYKQHSASNDTNIGPNEEDNVKVLSISSCDLGGSNDRLPNYKL